MWESWKSPTLYQLIFASGIITTLSVNAQTGDLTRVAFDKFLVGKLLSEHLADGEPRRERKQCCKDVLWLLR